MKTFIKNTFSVNVVRNIKKSDVAKLTVALCAGFIGFMVQGLTDYVWYNYRVFLMFWVVLSLVSVTVDLATREDKRTDDVESYLTGGQDEKAEIQIQI